MTRSFILWDAVSMPIALSQCRHSLKRLGLSTEGAGDTTIRTALLDARFVAGDAEPYRYLVRPLSTSMPIAGRGWPQEAFWRACQRSRSWHSHSRAPQSAGPLRC